MPSSAFLPDSPSPVKTRVKKESFQNKAHTIFSLSLTHEQNLDSYSNLPPNKSKGFFGKTLDKGKSFGRRIVQAIKIKFSDLKGKSKKGLASFMAVKADDIFCNPAIAHQMVYQSVESPQIEPLDKQEFQINPDKPVFKSYDLVRRKSAGVVVEIKYPRSCTLDDEKFTLGLDIDAESVEKIKCLSFIQNTQRDLEFSSSFPSESDCIFSIKDFPTTDEILKFIEFPMDSINKDRRDMPVRVNLFDENGHSISNSGYVSVDNNNWEKLSYCAEFINLSSANEFCLNMYSAKSLSLGVISIKGGCNNKDLSSAPYAINNLISSDEVQDYLPVIFPMPEPKKIEDIIEPLRLKHIRKPETLIKRNPLFQINQGALPEHEFLSSPSCNNKKVFPNKIGKEWSFGIQEMIRAFSSLNRRSSKNRIVATVSRDFLNYHNVPVNTVGFVWAYKGRSSDRNILFMDENSTEIGTLLHEMGHSLGQLKEFYKDFYDKKRTKPVLCQKFNGSSEVFCWNQYFIKTGFKALKGGSFEWLTPQKHSIMHGARESIYKEWIDRETFQKAFRFLKTSAVYHASFQAEYKQFPKLMVSGFYNKITNKMQALETESLEFKSAELTSPLTDGLSDEGRLDYIKIQLEQNNKTVYEVRHPSDMYVEIYREGGEYENETISLPTSLIHAVLPIIGKGEFKVRFFTGIFLFNDEGEVVDEAGEERLSQEIDFTWSER